MPGVLIVESLAQVGVVFIMLSVEERNDTTVFFRRIERAKFKKPVYPGDCLIQELSLIKQRGVIWVFEAKAIVKGEIVAAAELEATVVQK